ncbi:hypothetical protein A2954_01960 [Candidatus Roizmanbacteria bacterium RIFCSPLOWO2_01_FULL_37_12]|uniref:Plasmid stabilization protein n=1 Tax=Candidatus Roizmanbacteria bacterium RIFCSPLOWO2_01_FULL_37_12 TaxID=1802056 RepID=A0A1F7I9N2_9BACT|nr:MAG: hypothetical protein A2768_01445 [Candidatus Roizmanbacteria bacterium RIFCSPHIGHO2_01_FULL_37_16]OGK23285.1 MAG: hypothetical protein A3D76_00680 [Candidatus Roizmanbacteria bacterium RIFCSPHIGHO2_02_FULL_37_9b]OGK40057.1 MAG: hypothetical protein A2954_01960 [Candidatus Roizmanbacteria bacterium RIFCSPLOWO2_01_FULL_37_12]
MIVKYHKEFLRRFKKQRLKIKEKFKDRLSLFMKDEFDPTLNNHSLRGNYEGYRSINVTGDIRAVFKRTAQEAIFVSIDSHSNLYG